MSERPLRYPALQGNGRSEMEALVLQELIGTPAESLETWFPILNIMTAHRHNHESVVACHSACAHHAQSKYEQLATLVLDHCTQQHEKRSFDAFCQFSVLAIFRAGCEMQTTFERNIGKVFLHALCKFIVETFLPTQQHRPWHEGAVFTQLDQEVKRYFRPSHAFLRQTLMHDISDALCTIEESIDEKAENLRLFSDTHWGNDDIVGPGVGLYRSVMLSLIDPDRAGPTKLLSMARAQLSVR